MKITSFTIDKITDLLFELFDQYDVSDWDDISGDSILASIWVQLVKTTCIDGKDHDVELKQKLQEYLETEFSRENI